MTLTPKLSIGLIGSGFMGKSHVFGFATAAKVFDLPFEIELHTLADATMDAARTAAAVRCARRLRQRKRWSWPWHIRRRESRLCAPAH